MAKGNGRITRDMVDPTLSEVLARIDGLSAPYIERKCGVSHSTIRNWRNGRTRRPQNITMTYALRAAGYKRVIVPI
jgi:transcriptional regulator with XRE-family HTH domain